MTDEETTEKGYFKSFDYGIYIWEDGEVDTTIRPGYDRQEVLEMTLRLQKALRGSGYCLHCSKTRGQVDGGNVIQLKGGEENDGQKDDEGGGADSSA